MYINDHRVYTNQQCNIETFMRKIDIIPNWIYRKIGMDGLLHIIVTAILFKICWLIFGSFFGLILTIAIGIGKEIYDSKSGGMFSKTDLVCDVIGILLTLIINI